jgi:hypothetical protein
MFLQLVWTVMVVHLVSAGPWQAAADPTADFNARIAAYVALYRQAERSVPRQRVFADPVEAQAAVDAMAGAIRQLRRDAREGDVMSAEVGPVLREIIRTSLREAGVSMADLMDEDPPQGTPAVNETFRWWGSTPLPPCVLRALPSLPDELQYRFVRTDLVILDVHAGLVVDVLRDALKRPPPSDARVAKCHAATDPASASAPLSVSVTPYWNRPVAWRCIA